MTDPATGAADDTQAMLVDSARQLFASAHRAARIKLNSPEPQSFDPQLWRQMAELGWLALRLPEDLQGSQLGLSCAGALAEQLGAAKVPEPFIACGLIPAVICARLERSATRERLASDLLSGNTVWTLAWQEQPGQLDLQGCETHLSSFGQRLHGRKIFVPNIDVAHQVLVYAGGSHPALALIRTDSPGLHIESRQMSDRSRRGQLRLDAVPPETVLAVGPGARDLVQDAIAEATLAAAAYQAGLAESVLEQILGHLRTRVQFGRPLGTFQTLQHTAANLYMLIQLAGAAWRRAARAWDAEPGAESARMAISAAKARGADAAGRTARAGIQIFGGLGFAEEADCGLALRLAMLHASWLGSRRQHLRRFAQSFVQSHRSCG